MYAFIRRYRRGKGTIEELMSRVETQFASQISGGDAASPVEVPAGILSYQAIDTGDGTIVTITVFETEQQWRQARLGAEKIRLSLSDFEVEEIDTFGGPVKISKEAK